MYVYSAFVGILLTLQDQLQGVDRVYNFTTFPSRHSKEPFRFVYAGQPTFHAQPYRLPRSLNYNHWRRERLSLVTWDRLVEWLEDVSTRTAWTRPSFALMNGAMSSRETKWVSVQKSW